MQNRWPMRFARWPKSRLIKRAGSLPSDESGATAVEFSLIALPFFLMIFAAIEFGLAFVVNTMVDNATVSASRLIRTGQAFETLSAGEFKDEVCGALPTFLCNDERILVDVDSVATFAEAQGINSLYEDGELMGDADTNYNSGGAGDIVVVNVIYKWPMFTSLLNLDAADYGGERHLSSTVVFRNEPWE